MFVASSSSQYRQDRHHHDRHPSLYQKLVGVSQHSVTTLVLRLSSPSLHSEADPSTCWETRMIGINQSLVCHSSIATIDSFQYASDSFIHHLAVAVLFIVDCTIINSSTARSSSASSSDSPFVFLPRLVRILSFLFSRSCLFAPSSSSFFLLPLAYRFALQSHFVNVG